MSSRSALVTGGTGFVGSHLVRDLLAEGWEVRTCGRGPRPEDLDPAVAYHRADLAGDALLEPLVDGAGLVFHLAGLSSSVATPGEMYRANVDGTRRLVQAARKAQVERLVHVSTTSVYGKKIQLPQPVPEDVEPHPGEGYAESKWLAEEEVRSGLDDGLPATILRPVTVYGPGAVKLVASTILDAAIERHAGLASFVVPADPVELRLVHVDDVVGAMRHLAAHDDAVGGAFNLASGVYPSSHEVGGLVAEELGLDLEPTDDPDAGLDYARRSEVYEQMLAEGMQPGIMLKEKRIRFLKKANPNNRVSLEALAATGYEPRRTDLPETIPESVDWYRSQRWIL